jgi:uncharacterized protein (TIGR00725 family)
MAYQAGQLIAEQGFGLVCGGLAGVMGAACRGAFEGDGLTVGILPGSDTGEANAFVRVCIPTGMGEGRNLLVVRASEALLALGGGMGTLSEIALALKLGVPVFGVKTWVPVDGEGRPAPILKFESVTDAMQAILEHRNILSSQGGGD